MYKLSSNPSIKSGHGPVGIHASIGILACVMIFTQTVNAQPIGWIGGDGVWSNPANWEMGNVPNQPKELPILAGNSAYRVTMDESYSFGRFSILNPHAVLEVAAGLYPQVFGDLVNNGLITINPTHANENTGLTFWEESTISGTGTIRLNAIEDSNQASVGSFWSDENSFTNGSGHTIAGSGQIGMSFINQGNIVADGPEGTLIEIGQQYLHPFQQTGDGLIHAKSGDIVFNSDAFIEGGTLRSDPNTSILVKMDLHLGHVTNDATLDFVGENGQLISVNGELTNNERIVLHSESRFDSTNLSITGDSTIGGTGEIVLGEDDYSNSMTIRPGFILTHNHGHTIRGQGSITAQEKSTFINHGEIIAHGENALLTLTGSFEGNGAFIAEDGTEIRFEAGAGEMVSLEGINMSTLGDSNIKIRSRVGVSNFTNHGFLGVYGFDDPTQIGGMIENQGTIEIRGISNVSQATTFSGTGSVVMSGDGVLQASLEETITNAPDHTFSLQDGEVVGPFVNNGTMKGWGVLRGPFTNNTTVRASGYADLTGYILTVIGDHTQGNGVYDGGNQVLRLFDCTVANKVFESDPDGTVVFVDTDFTSITNNGILRSYSQQESTMSGTFTNNNTLLLNGSDSQSLRFMNSMTIEGAGLVELRGTNLLNPPELVADGESVITINPDHTVLGHGRLEGAFLMQGVLDPFKASALNFAPAISVDNLTLASSTLVQLNLLDAFGKVEHIKVEEGGVIHLAGTLEVEVSQGIEPNFGQWVLIDGQTGSHIIGEFDQINLPDAPINRRYRMQRTENQLILVLTCLSDINGDFVFDSSDVLGFVSAYETQHPDADINGDGVLNFFDVSVFLLDFAAPCQ